MNKVKVQLNVSTKWIILFFVLTTFTSCSNKKKIEVKNNNGVVVESYFVDKKNPDIKIGVYSKFYDDGKILEVANYSNGKINGERTLYYPNGKIMQVENYKDNKFDGKFTAYNEDGSLQQEGNYKDNMMNGVWKNYFKDQKNKVKEEITLKDNHINGLYKEYYPNGNLYASGNKKEIMEDLDVFDGEVLIFDSVVNNKLIRKLHFENGRQVYKEEIIN